MDNIIINNRLYSATSVEVKDHILQGYDHILVSVPYNAIVAYEIVQLHKKLTLFTVEYNGIEYKECAIIEVKGNTNGISKTLPMIFKISY